MINCVTFGGKKKMNKAYGIEYRILVLINIQKQKGKKKQIDYNRQTLNKLNATVFYV